MELAGRTCYKSEDKITPISHERFLWSIIQRGHESVLEHSAISVKFITSRAMSHQLVRHRLCSYSQESMRYCNYTKDKFEDGVVFIEPYGFDEWDKHTRVVWENSMMLCEEVYSRLIEQNVKPEAARGVLPQDTKTEIVVTANVRQWRHIFRMRLDKHAQPQMRALMEPLFRDLLNRVSFLFADLIHKDHE